MRHGKGHKGQNIFFNCSAFISDILVKSMQLEINVWLGIVISKNENQTTINNTAIDSVMSVVYKNSLMEAKRLLHMYQLIN